LVTNILPLEGALGNLRRRLARKTKRRISGSDKKVRKQTPRGLTNQWEKTSHGHSSYRAAVCSTRVILTPAMPDHKEVYAVLDMSRWRR